MSGIKSESLAGALLGHITDQKVVDLLMPRAEISGPIKFSASPSDSTASKYIKGKLNHANSIAQDPGTSPDVLTRYAKDTRVSVRRALMQNPSTPYETLLTLAEWAHDKLDEGMTTVILRLAPDDIIKTLTRKTLGGYDLSSSKRDYPFQQVAKIIAKHNSADNILALHKMRISEFSNPLAVHLYHASKPAVTLTELVKSDTETSTALIEAVALSAQECTFELAALMAGSVDASAHFRLSSFLMLNDRSAEMLLTAPNPTVRRYATSSGARGEALTPTLQTANARMLQAICNDVGPHFTKKQEQLIITRLIALQNETDDYYTKEAFAAAMRVATHRVPSSLLLEAFRSIGGGAVADWLNGQLGVNTPRKGEITSLAESPVNAFTSTQPPHYRRYSPVPVTNTVTAPVDVRNFFLRSLNWAMANAWADEFAQVIGELIIPRIAGSSVTGKWVAKRFHDSFGADEGCWETSITLASSWTGSIDELIETTMTVNDFEPIQMIEPVKPQQLTLTE